MSARLCVTVTQLSPRGPCLSVFAGVENLETDEPLRIVDPLPLGVGGHVEAFRMGRRRPIISETGASFRDRHTDHRIGEITQLQRLLW